ncbi:MAG: lysine--tRNA ligase, partial [Microvirga sp.]
MSAISIEPALAEAAQSAAAWPFEEARKLVSRLERTGKNEALFETGYGPSGLPHIGTFAEVFRTTLVRQAFARLSDLPTELYAYSDDMDGLRKVPNNVPNQAAVAEHLGRPLTDIPDPFGTHESYGAHMNARLRTFLDQFGFAYTFKSGTEVYRSGALNGALLKVLERHDAIRKVVLPTLGPERRATYSPILPVSPKSGRVLQVPIEECRPAQGTVVFRDEDGTLAEVPVTDGHCKMQWKCDWALRWAALDVDYEMSGKDLIDSVKLSGQICRVLGGTPPASFTYELFNDENGQKISKSKGNGLTIEEWLRYAPPESLAYFMYQSPQRAKRLFFDVIPRAVDEYLGNLEKLRTQPEPTNPAFHIHNGSSNDPGSPIPFTMLLNLASVINATGPEMLWGFIRRYAPDVTPESNPILDRLAGYAVAYYRDFVAPTRRHRAPTALERTALADLLQVLRSLPEDSTAEAIQDFLYEVGKRHPFATLRDWFACLYQVLLGAQEGPRFGGFVALYGIPGTIGLIETALARGAGETLPPDEGP